MSKCSQCDSSNNINNYNFEWKDSKNNINILPLLLCCNCATNARITYDVYGVPQRSSSAEVINNFLVFTDDIEDKWSEYHYLSLPSK